MVFWGISDEIAYWVLGMFGRFIEVYFSSFLFCFVLCSVLFDSAGISHCLNQQSGFTSNLIQNLIVSASVISIN
jgi:hypothetical protein